MAGFDYNFKNSSSDFKRRNESRDRKVRLTALFCIVATITAIVIFAIIPSSEAKDKDKTDVNDGDTPEEVVTQSGDSENAVSGEEKKTVNLTETVPPERSGNANPDAEEKLNAALNRGDFKAFFQLADKLISATAPDSEARARLGAILTRGRKKRGRAANGKLMPPNTGWSPEIICCGSPKKIIPRWKCSWRATTLPKKAVSAFLKNSI